MELHNMAIGRALAWERTPEGVRFRCVAGGLVAANVTLSAVAPTIIRVRVTPGTLPPTKGFSYTIHRPAETPIGVEEGEGSVRLVTPALCVEVTLDPWHLCFRTADGRLLTEEIPGDSNFGGHALAPPPGFEVEGLPHDPARQISAVIETLLLDSEDHFYGGGEKFTRLDHVGRTIRTWQRNPYGTRTELAYKNMPILVGTRGYGIFVDLPTAVTFHLGSLSNRSYTIQAAGRELDYYLIGGAPKEIVAGYTELTGRPAVPPEWAFGLWASSAFVKTTEASVKAQAERLRKEDIPFDVYHFDCFWQRPLMWCDLEWDA